MSTPLGRWLEREKRTLSRYHDVVIALQNLVWAWDQREGVEIAQKAAREVLRKIHEEELLQERNSDAASLQKEAELHSCGHPDSAHGCSTDTFCCPGDHDRRTYRDEVPDFGLQAAYEDERRLTWWVRMTREPGVWAFLIVAAGISAGFLVVDMPRAALAVWAAVFIGACFAWLGDSVRP